MQIIDKEIKTTFETTPATQGIEYEEDPVAKAMIGDLDNLNTTNKENIVIAINSILTIIGSLKNLSTNDKTTLVNAINELKTNIGNFDNLADYYPCNNLVSALNYVLTITGLTSVLSTTNKSTLVSAINEVVTKMGDLSNLSTDDKTSLVNAINEVSQGASDNVLFSGSIDIGGINTIEVLSTTRDISNVNLRAKVRTASGNLQVINLCTTGEKAVLGQMDNNFTYTESKKILVWDHYLFQYVKSDGITKIKASVEEKGINFNTGSYSDEAGYGKLEMIEIVK